MLGWIVWQEAGRGKVQSTQCAVGGVTFWKLSGPAPRHFWGRRQWRRCLQQLGRSGVRRVAVQGKVPPELLRQFALQPVDPSPLRLALLPQLLAHVQREWELPVQRGAVTLRSAGADKDVWQAAQVLARKARYLHLDIQTGRAEMEELLRRRYGLVIGGTGQTVLEVCVGCASGGTVPALHLGDGCAIRQQVELESEALPEANEQLLSAIFQAGKLKIEEIRVRSVEFSA